MTIAAEDKNAEGSDGFIGDADAADKGADALAADAAAMNEELDVTEARLKVLCADNGLDFVIARKTMPTPDGASQSVVFYNGPLFDRYGEKIDMRTYAARDVLIELLASVQDMMLKLCQARGLGLAPVREVAAVMNERRELVRKCAELSSIMSQKKVADAIRECELENSKPAAEEAYDPPSDCTGDGGV
jgi:hypothetical protein